MSEYFDDLEVMSPEARAKYQDKNLARTITRAYRHAPSVKRIFDKAAIKPSDFRSVKDLVNTINHFVQEHNARSTPFAWTATAD